MNGSVKYFNKKTALGVVLSSSMLMGAGVFASNDQSSSYEKYTPENQFPVKFDCNTTLGGNDELPMIAQVDQAVDKSDPHWHHRQMLTKKQDYKRSEHSYTLPGLPLVAMDGEETSLQEALDSDQPVMLNFIFTTCTTICPVLSATFSQVQEQMGEEVQDIKMISITIDPEYDTPEKLQAYAKRFNAGSQWQFYTGDLSDIISIEKAFNVYRGTKMSHEPTTFIRSDKDASWVRIDGIASADDVLKEYRRVVQR